MISDFTGRFFSRQIPWRKELFFKEQNMKYTKFTKLTKLTVSYKSQHLRMNCCLCSLKYEHV